MNAQTQTPTQAPTQARPAFGSVLASTMAMATYAGGRWSAHEFKPVGPIPLSPAAHVLHYASTLFEGFKAYRWDDGSVNVFRMDRHIQRMQQSARALALAEPESGQLAEMVLGVIDRVREEVPEAPGALYLRPLLFGTTPNIGAAATPPSELMLLVMASPVWDYFAGGMKPLKIHVETQATRCASHLGMVKTGGNYAAAMGPTLAAKREYGVDQVLFCPGGEVQETGASNFLLIREGHILTRSLDATFLHGVTRDSLLHVAPELGYRVEERVFTVADMLEWVRDGEAALSGTAAVLAGVGTLMVEGQPHLVGNGEVGPHTRRLREVLVSMQQGTRPAPEGWLRRV
ncbi:MAG: branched-chain amino acid aminotransferase [Steroidobacteraceae bacterium]